ncbi:tetratricopeptide repeat protein [Pimelobacter simplex]|uniref:tetratricopeptide repeat protein n=1 Tax=Nocardioides simplex TaxID=2045 RepID=UPI001375451A|nr:tetratricopeptide repeat protein [Pimelobacter simplex]
MADVQALQRAEALLDLGRAREAESILRDLLASDPSDPQLLYALTRAVHGQQRYAEARDLALRGLREAPEHLGLLLSLAAAHGGLEDFAAALVAVRSASQIAPEYAGVHAQEGVILLADDRPQEALVALDRAQRLDPEDSGTVALRAAAHLELRDYGAAEDAVARALSLDPDNAEAHRIKGVLALVRGRGSSAVAAHRSALRLDPVNADFREGMATALKSRNPLYGLLLRYGHWLEGLPGGARWLMLLAPLLLIRVLRPVHDEPWAMALLVVVVAFVVLSWVLEPLQNAILLCSAYSRNLLTSRAKQATYTFLALLAASAAAAGAGIATGNEDFLLLALAFAIWSVTAGQIHGVARRRFRLAAILQSAGGVLGLISFVLVAAGVTGLGSLVGVYFVAGLAMVWFVVLA